MAESNNPAHQQSLYMHKTIGQVSSDDQAGGAASEPAVSPDLQRLSSFGGEFRLICAVCLQDLKQPKQLKSCYHIFCKDCLQPFMEKARDGQVTCPLTSCSRTCPVEDITRALSSDTYMHAFQGQVGIYAESGGVLCNAMNHDPDDVQAAYFCLECGKNFCDLCKTDHSYNDEFKQHHLLKLFKTPVEMTVAINRSCDSLLNLPYDEADGTSYKCPICRNTDRCEHEHWLKELLDENFLRNEKCDIPEHTNGNELNAYCSEPGCEKPICRNCSMIEHRDHNIKGIGEAMQDKLLELKSLKKMLVFQEEMFVDATKRCKDAESSFRKHILETEQQMIARKGSMHTQVEEAFGTAFGLIEQTGRKQAELNRQSGEMYQEQEFLQTAIRLAEKALDNAETKIQTLRGTERFKYLVEVVRIWKGLKHILEDLGGEKKKGSHEVVVPQVIVEKRLVLPAPCVMSPDLSILHKVGVENTVLQLAFCLKAEPELLLFYSILPLSQTEALLACKPASCKTAVVQYSYVLPHQRPRILEMQGSGELCITAVPGNGVVATHYSRPGGCASGESPKNQVLFWDEVLAASMKQLEARGAGDKLKVLTTTALPPRGLGVTKDSHVVVLTAADASSPSADPPQSEESLVLLMTLQGDVVRKTDRLKCPRYVTVNINDDICVSDLKDRAVIILNRALRVTNRFVNPYNSDRDNSRFCPRGICHDSFGRLIVADPDNNAVLRIEYEAGGSEPLFSTILKNNLDGITDLDCPMLVAMSPGLPDHGPRLWVVCRSNIHVYDYMDKE